MQIHLERLPSDPILYMRRTGSYGPENHQLMEQFKAWADRRGLLDESATVVGIPWDDARTTPPAQCRYDVGLLLQEPENWREDGVCAGALSGGLYLVLELDHTAQAVAAAWSAIFPTLEQLGLHPDPARLIFERYRTELLAVHRCELCIPVEEPGPA